MPPCGKPWPGNMAGPFCLVNGEMQATEYHEHVHTHVGLFILESSSFFVDLLSSCLVPAEGKLQLRCVLLAV